MRGLFSLDPARQIVKNVPGYHQRHLFQIGQVQKKQQSHPDDLFAWRQSKQVLTLSYRWEYF